MTQIFNTTKLNIKNLWSIRFLFDNSKLFYLIWTDDECTNVLQQKKKKKNKQSQPQIYRPKNITTCLHKLLVFCHLYDTSK